MRKWVYLRLFSSLFLFNLLLFHLLEERAILDIRDFLLLLLRIDKSLPTIHHALLVISFWYPRIGQLNRWELIHGSGSGLISLHQSCTTTIHLNPNLRSRVYFSLSPRLLLKLIPPYSFESGLSYLQLIRQLYCLFNRLFKLYLSL